MEPGPPETSIVAAVYTTCFLFYKIVVSLLCNCGTHVNSLSCRELGVVDIAAKQQKGRWVHSDIKITVLPAMAVAY
jgi:hypothetical protein